ncbi:hypothetical protein P280DRAFT_493132 [Massarina eburnea CBS 473.64]|uniref:Integral membrane protein n=1 Tax=Massarina eburnea CBS 473.64 TaxID=1395130 RepID=A0A6A6RNU5_9PLEO|nr:hypothetical protein P280DRAFT_493132 [Massarina eburnea CBS 473.64]
MFKSRSGSMTYLISLLVGFAFLYTSLTLHFREKCYADPTSYFYQPRRAHQAPYSTHRIQQATRYAAGLGSSLRNVDPSTHHQIAYKMSSPPPEICIGVPSVTRPGISYLKTTLGSMQDTLTSSQRSTLHFVVLLAHTNQSEHEDHGTPWLEAMADTVLSYDLPSDDGSRIAVAQMMEENGIHAVKSKFDYAITLEECVRTGAEWVMMLEDDVVFREGWLDKVRGALQEVDKKTRGMGMDEFLYLRLFYYEGLLGWNSESWPKYIGISTLLTALTTFLTYLLLCPLRRLLNNYLSVPIRNPSPATLLFPLLTTPLLIALYFLAGAPCLQSPAHGVSLMPSHGCCGQGLVFPRSTVQDHLLPYFREHKWSETPVDSFIEEFARDAESQGLWLGRWAVTPVVLQHVGTTSSHGVVRDGGFGDTMPDGIWNFGFERNEVTGESV